MFQNTLYLSFKGPSQLNFCSNQVQQLITITANDATMNVMI